VSELESNFATADCCICQFHKTVYKLYFVITTTQTHKNNK